MRFSVPQFIEEKPKIVGPLTLQQFLYVAGGAGIAVLAFYTVNNFILKFFIGILSGGLGVALAFVKINGQDLPQLVLSALNFWQKPRTYVWKRELPTQTIDISSFQKIQERRRNMSLQEKIKTAALKAATGRLPFLGGRGKEGGQKEKYQTVRFMTGERMRVKRVDY